MKITLESGSTPYRYLWIKGIRGVDLSQHCASTFVGPYVPDVDAKSPDGEFELDDRPDVHAWYLCGVAGGRWDWQRNAHLAFVPAPGETWDGIASQPGGTGDLLVHLVDAAPVLGWGEHDVDDSHEKAYVKSYRTCRNWQFAHYLARVRGLTSTPTYRGPRR